MKHLKPFLVLTVLLVIAVVVAIPCFAADTIPAHASSAEAATTSPWVTFLQQTIFPLLTAFLMGIVTWLSKLLGKKFHLDSLTKENNLLEQLAYQGITKAEEVAAKYVGSKDSLNGRDKLSIAVSHILTVMPKVSNEQAEAVVHALLAQIPGVGASGDAAYLPPGSGLAAALVAPASTPAEEPAPAAA